MEFDDIKLIVTRVGRLLSPKKSFKNKGKQQ